MKNKIILILMLIILASQGVACLNGSIDRASKASEPIRAEDDYYKIIKHNDDEFSVVLYDKDKKVVHEEKYPIEPIVSILDNKIIEIRISLGNPNSYVYFFDTETNKVSEVYYNPRLVENGKIIFVKEGKLVVSDIFNRKVLYKEININFPPVAEPSHLIYEIKFIQPDKLFIKYLEGEALLEMTQIIDLSK